MTHSHNNKRKPPARKSGRRVITIALISIAILLPTLMYYFKYQTIIHNKGKKVVVPTSPLTAKTAAGKSTVEFDFYTLLAKIETPVNQTVSNKQTPLPVKAETKLTRYVLQVASLQQLSDAVRLQDELKSLGFVTFIQIYKTNHQQWHRVLIGPFASLENATQAQRKLNSDKLDSLLLTLKTG